MQIVKLDAIGSTNAYIKQSIREEGMQTNTVVVAQNQYEGKGQMGASWISEPGKNLTFSVLKTFSAFKTTDQFYLNIVVCLSIYNTLWSLKIPNLSIKWPNDILSGNEKLCGVLIETILVGDNIKQAIIGIGLNVNQTKFPNLSSVSSLKLLTGVTYNHDEVLQKLLYQLNDQFLRIAAHDSLRSAYESKLFKKDQQSTFELQDGSRKMGCIRSVSFEGKLQIEFDDQTTGAFNFKEVRLLY